MISMQDLSKHLISNQAAVNKQKLLGQVRQTKGATESTY